MKKKFLLLLLKFFIVRINEIKFSDSPDSNNGYMCMDFCGDGEFFDVYFYKDEVIILEGNKLVTKIKI